MADAQIFISYRRDDSSGYARALHEELARQWGAERVFIDVDDIDAGESFASVIEQAVADAPVMLVLIGPRWQGLREGQAPRLNDEQDLVRREVATALGRGMTVIPVLLDGAPMPATSALPQALWPLVERNALVLSPTSYAADMQRLLGALRAPMGPPAAVADKVPIPFASPVSDVWQARSRPTAASARGKRLWMWMWAGAAVVAVLSVALAWSRFSSDPRPRAAIQAETAAKLTLTLPRAQVNGVWTAPVLYDWPNANFQERFDFSGSGNKLVGTATFLAVPRVVHEGRVEGDRLHFTTRSTELLGNTTREVLHRYSAQWVEGTLRFVHLTEGANSVHLPVVFVATPQAASASTLSGVASAPR